MKKRFVAILAISMLAVLTACGNKNQGTESATSEIQASDIKESEEAVDLTQEELDSFTELFGTSEYNGFVVSPFNDVNDIDWAEVFFNGAGIAAADVSEEESDNAYKHFGDDCGDLITLRADDIDSFVESHTGIKDDIKDQIGYDYIEEYDSYYALHGDSNWTPYECTSGIKLGDLYVVEMHNVPPEDVEWHAWDTPDIELTFEKNGDVYRMISNVWHWEDGNDPDQTFDINLPGHEKGRVITYQGDQKTGEAANMVVTADGKRVCWLANWFLDDERVSTDFITINAVGSFDFSADGVDDIVVVAEDTEGDEHVGLYEYQFVYGSEGYNYHADASDWISTYYSEELTIPNVKEYLLGDNQKAVYPTWKEAYKQVVRLTNLDDSYSYNLIYLDDDDVPELVIDNYGYYFFLYSYKDGHVVPVGEDFGYGAGGIADYEYVPKKNCIRYWNSDYAGIVCDLHFISIHDGKIVYDYTCQMDNYDDLDGNGYPSEDEMTEEALAKATGSTSYYANDKSLSQDVIEKKIEELQEYEYETIHGQYDSVDFYDVMAKM